MAKDSIKKTELNAEDRIKKEIERINFYFQELPENELAIIFPLIEQAAFMRCTLNDLQNYVAEHGAVEHYSNGATQQGLKQSSALQAYNKLIANYMAVIRSLAQYLPPMKRKELIEQPIKIADPEESEEEREAARERDNALGKKYGELVARERAGEITNKEKWDLLRQYQKEVNAE